MSQIGQLQQGAPGNSAALIDVAGTAVQIHSTSVAGPHFVVRALPTNTKPIVLGYGALTKVDVGFNFQELRPGDYFEFQTTLDSYHWFDMSTLWINNDAVTGHASDGVSIAKLGPE